MRKAPFECPQDRPFESLRTGSGGERILEARLWWGVGDAMGDGDAPRRAPLDSCLRRNDACGRPPSSALRTGFDRGERTREARLRWGVGVRWGTDAPRGALLVAPPFECPQDRLRQAQGERIREARVRWGVGDAMGDGDAPRLAPLDSCLRRNDACGRPPSSALRTGFDRLRANGFGKRAYDGEWGMRWGTETPRAAPLWIPAFAGMTRAEGPLRVPSGQASTGSGRTDAGSAPAVGSRGCDGVGDAPRLAPLDSCLRRNDACGRPPSSALSNCYGWQGGVGSRGSGGGRWQDGEELVHRRRCHLLGFALGHQPVVEGDDRIGAQGRDGGHVEGGAHGARPPQQDRGPWGPLSWERGARPTNAASNAPNSGRSAPLRMGPPAALRPSNGEMAHPPGDLPVQVRQLRGTATFRHDTGPCGLEFRGAHLDHLAAAGSQGRQVAVSLGGGRLGGDLPLGRSGQ